MNGKDSISLLKRVISKDEIINLIGELVRRPSYIGLPRKETEVAEYIFDFFNNSYKFL